MNKGKVYLVGAGPGSPDLITVRGRKILRQADVVIYDYLVDKRILDEASSGAKLVCCDKPDKKKYRDGLAMRNEKINQLVINNVKQGKKVIRLKNGDPAIFSRISQELEPLFKNKIELEIVPGVTAASASSCLSGIPLTDRRFASSCVFVTGHEDPAKKESYIDWNCVAQNTTIVLYMAVENLGRIVKELKKSGKKQSTAIAIVQDAGLLTQKVITGTLNDIVKKARGVKPPAIIIVGDVAKLEKKYNWLKKTKRILFTGLSKERFFIKGAYFHLPLIRIEPMEDYTEFDNYLKNIRKFDWLAFSSRYGVEYFFKRLAATDKDIRALAGVKIAAIGSSTANSLKDIGIVADLVPKNESAKGLLGEFGRIGVRNKNIFLPRSDISDKNLSSGLKKLGAKPTTGFAYRNVPAKHLPDLDLSYFNEIVFTSPSGVRNFVNRYVCIPKAVKIRCIGDVTRREAKRCRLLD